MNDENDFYKDVPFTIDGKEQFCCMCKEQIFVGDYIEKHTNEDCSETVLMCRNCLIENGFALGPKMEVIDGGKEEELTYFELSDLEDADLELG